MTHKIVLTGASDTGKTAFKLALGDNPATKTVTETYCGNADIKISNFELVEISEKCHLYDKNIKNFYKGAEGDLYLLI